MKQQELIKISVVILAAGKGTRMSSTLPKLLHRICGKPLLYYAFKLVKGLANVIQESAKLDRVYVVVGYEADKIRTVFKNENVCWLHQNEQRGTGNALAIAKPRLQHSEHIILVLCGDAPLLTAETLKRLIQVHLDSPKSAATILTCQLDNPTGYGRILRSRKGMVKGIIEEQEADATQKKIREINSGTYIFDAAVFETLKKITPHSENGEYYLTDAIGILEKDGGNIKTYLAENASECLGVNTDYELNAVSKLMHQRMINDLTQKGVIVVAPENTYIEEEVTIGKDTVIYPFSVIRSGVMIGQRCEVGPFSHLRSGTVLQDNAEVGNFTETKKTILGQHSKAKHLSYLGDTVIGNNVNIGAGTITANFDGVRKEQTIIEDGASTGSGTILIAPLKMGKNTRTGAGAVVPKGTTIPDGITVVGIPAKPLKSKSR